MSLPDAAAQAWMRNVVDEHLVADAVVVQRVTATKSAGRPVETWTTVATVAGRLDPVRQRGSDKRAQIGTIEAVTDWVVTVPHDTDVNETTDRLVVGGVTYRIQSIAANRSVQVSKQIQCVRFV